MKTIRGTLLLAGVLNGAWVAAAQAPEQADGFQISVNVNLVVLQATVRDAKGGAVKELRQENFQVFEDGAAQHIALFRHADTPVTVGLVIDHSGSMREKLAEVTTAARAFVQSSNPQDQMFVVNFNEHVSLGLSGGTPFSDSASQLGNAIGEARASGTTALYDAITEALRRLQAGASDKKVLLVISDGGDNASQTTLDQVLLMAEQANAMIYTIGVFGPGDADRNPKVLQRLAHQTGGEAFFPSQLSDTVNICQRIAREIRDQYTIGYSPSAVDSSSTKFRNPNRESMEQRVAHYHKVKLTARGGENEPLTVRTRAGYSSGLAK